MTKLVICDLSLNDMLTGEEPSTYRHAHLEEFLESFDRVPLAPDEEDLAYQCKMNAAIESGAVRSERVQRELGVASAGDLSAFVLTTKTRESSGTIGHFHVDRASSERLLLLYAMGGQFKSEPWPWPTVLITAIRYLAYAV